MSQTEDAKGFSSSLHRSLVDLAHNPYPHIPNPERCKKRASVALVLRIRPNYKDWPTSSDSIALDTNQPVEEQLAAFFAQSWVQNGDAEAVFIKRAARVGDRWTSHVALPGGKRDPEDEDDRATAIRETSEEIGLDISSSDTLYIGNLPERVVSTSFGSIPIMVLCPFIFLYTKPEIPPFKLQPTEVASTHWVPLRVLLSPSVRTYEYVDTTDRLARQGGFILRYLMLSILGKMRFSAVRLIPSESVYCTSTEEFFPSEDIDNIVRPSLRDKLYKMCLGDHSRSSSKSSPLLLWGLTLGVFADFLDLLPPHNAVQLWSYPTFTTWDAQFFITILTAGIKKRNRSRLLASNQTAIDGQTEAIVPSEGNPWVASSDGAIIKSKDGNASKSYAVGVMLDGYYDRLKTAARLTAVTRVLTSLALIIYVIRKFKR